MQRLPVESSDLVSIGYDPAQKLLEVEFQGGRVYQYRNVEPETHAQFMRADSYGTFFFAHINGQYRYDKITSPDDDTTDDSLALVSATPGDLRTLQIACEPYAIDVSPLELPLDQVQSDDAQEIATKKAKQAFKLAKQPVVVSISFWNILALRGFPGAYMEAMDRWLQPADFLQLLEKKTDRSVCLTTVVAYYDGKRHKLFTYDYWGTITDEPKGQGTPIEQIVVLKGQDKTIAEQHSAGLNTWLTPEDSAWHDFAKWLHVRRRFSAGF